MEKINMKNKVVDHTKYGLRECDDDPVIFTLSGIINSLNTSQSTEGGADTSIDNGYWVPARYRTCVMGIRHIKNRIKLAWEILTGRADILYYR